MEPHFTEANVMELHFSYSIRSARLEYSLFSMSFLVCADLVRSGPMSTIRSARLDSSILYPVSYCCRDI